MPNIRIMPNGELLMVYSDELTPALMEAYGDEGSGQIQRASHVEPGPGGWLADLSPVNGPILGPFPLRQTALDAEVAWLNANLLLA